MDRDILFVTSKQHGPRLISLERTPVEASDFLVTLFSLIGGEQSPERVVDSFI